MVDEARSINFGRLALATAAAVKAQFGGRFGRWRFELEHMFASLYKWHSKSDDVTKGRVRQAVRVRTIPDRATVI